MKAWIISDDEYEVLKEAIELADHAFSDFVEFESGVSQPKLNLTKQQAQQYIELDEEFVIQNLKDIKDYYEEKIYAASARGKSPAQWMKKLSVLSIMLNQLDK